jgi:DNA-3-methyladenine glycosylase
LNSERQYIQSIDTLSPLNLKLTESFYRRKNVVTIARELLGKGLFTCIDNVITGGIVVETEAYSWKERGCHAFGGKKTNRNAVMFEGGGVVYVYVCYGMHHLVNIVTNRENVAEAVLIRAIEPVEGLSTMFRRRPLIKKEYHLTSGPGKLTRALGIDRNWNGKSLLNSEIWIEDLKFKISRPQITCGPRIGIDYAGDDAKLPWRFCLKDNLWLSQ